MSMIRRLGLVALASGPLLAVPSVADAAAVPQYVISFAATTGPASTTGITFHSTRCTISPALNPLVAACTESGTVRFSTTGGSGTAVESSALAGISWKFKLVRSGAISPSITYKMTGTGSETVGTTGVLRPVQVTGTITTLPTVVPTFSGTEDVYPLLPPA